MGRDRKRGSRKMRRKKEKSKRGRKGERGREGGEREGGKEERLSFFPRIMQCIHHSAKAWVKHKNKPCLLGPELQTTSCLAQGRIHSPL